MGQGPWDRSGDPLRGPGRVGGPSAMSETGRGTLEEVRDRLLDSWIGPGWVGVPRESLGRVGELRDGMEGPRGDPGWVGGPSGRSKSGRGTLGKVRNGLGDPR